MIASIHMTQPAGHMHPRKLYTSLCECADARERATSGLAFMREACGAEEGYLLLWRGGELVLAASSTGHDAPSAIMAKARTTRNAQVTLTVQSTDDLRSGTVTLPASLITWTAQGSGFVPGTMSMSSAQVVGTWTGSGVRSGSQSFLFQNAWTHPPGVYSLTLVYTISAP